MNTSTQRVLKELEYAGSKGITHKNFGVGFALRSRIADLRDMGYEIITKQEDNNHGWGWHGLYVLIGKK